MLNLFRPRPAAAEDCAPAAERRNDGDALVQRLVRETAHLGREAAEVRGVIDDTQKAAVRLAGSVQALVQRLADVSQVQGKIGEHTAQGSAAVGRAREAVETVGGEVAGIVDTLREVASAAGEITQIALQTRLVAFNASVEAKRAGEAGRGFGVVADAVKDLAAKVERSSKLIMDTVGRLDGRIAALAREIQARGSGAAGDSGAVHRALAQVDEGVARIAASALQSREAVADVNRQMGAIETDMRGSASALDSALKRSEAFLQASESLIEIIADAGVETPDSVYIRTAQQVAAQVAQLFEGALRSGAIGAAELFDEHYVPIPGSNPQQHLTKFVALAERLLPQVQEKVLEIDKVVFCIAVDRNGYIPCHNRQYNQPQRPGDVAWNTAHSRGRRIFNDRTGLSSARNQRPFLLQTYRRDMGGGNFVVMKEAAAPIVVDGRHWGGLRLAFKF
jgi:methyl-accepting chemotaxis protein